MAGLIRREDIDEVRSRTRIEDVVSQYVQLRPDGVDSQKGLCPFHDEKTPSLHIRPHIGRWHCFGCGEGGDVISFVERIEHVSFVEAVEILARKAGVELRYENDGRRERGDSGATRQRLIDAHRVAVDFYMAQLASLAKLDRPSSPASPISLFLTPSWPPPMGATASAAAVAVIHRPHPAYLVDADAPPPDRTLARLSPSPRQDPLRTGAASSP